MAVKESFKSRDFPPPGDLGEEAPSRVRVVASPRAYGFPPFDARCELALGCVEAYSGRGGDRAQLETFGAENMRLVIRDLDETFWWRALTEGGIAWRDDLFRNRFLREVL